MTETKTPNPDCTACAGTGFIPPFMDPCDCEIPTPVVDTPAWLPPLSSVPMGSYGAGSKIAPHRSGDDLFDELMDQANDWDAEQQAAADVDEAERAAAFALDEVDEQQKQTDLDAVYGPAVDVTPAVGAPIIDGVIVEGTPVPDYAAGYGEAGIYSDPSISYAPAKTAKPMTASQEALLRKLIAERDPTNSVVVAATAEVGWALTAKRASQLIDGLMAVPADPAKKAPRSNNYDGTCRDCGGPVPATTGRIEKVDGRWVTYHLAGGCLTPEAKAEAFANRVVEPGLYKHEPDMGVDIYRVRKSRTSARLYAEKVCVHEHDDEKSVAFAYNAKAMGFLRASDKLTWAEARAFGAAYGSCVACGRTLSDPRSLVQGYGATCAGHYSWPTVTAKQAEAIIDGVLAWDDVISGLGVLTS